MDTDKEILLYKIAFSMTQGVNAAVAEALMNRGVELRDFFRMDTESLCAALGLNRGFRIQQASREEALARARKELEFIGRHDMRAIFIYDDEYPVMLRELRDAPVVLYQYGHTDLNREEIMAVVGTRHPTPYGLKWCDDFVRDTGAYFPDMIVASGLAYGIDAAAHRSALENGITTVAVVAHGLDTIYPAEHRQLAYDIVRQGGSILSEYPSGTRSYRQNFLARNRIVAGMSQLTVVVESEVKGGAMSTANVAFVNNRELMALPGRVGDRMSEGCNLLIRREKAHLVTSAADVVEMMDWRPMDLKVTPTERNLFPELDPALKPVYDFLRMQQDPVHIDIIHSRTSIPMQKLTGILSEMEFDGIVLRHPGNRFSIS